MARARLAREQIYEWEREWRPGRVEEGALGLVGGPKDLSILNALACVTGLPDLADILPACAVGYLVVGEFGAGEEGLEAGRNRDWLGKVGQKFAPPWWPMVTSVRSANWLEERSEPARTLTDTFAGHRLGAAVAAVMEAQRLVVDNRSLGGALWVHTPKPVARTPGWTWSRHGRVGKWGMNCKLPGDCAELVGQLAEAYAEQHGSEGLVGLVASY
jgi:hypothetical protein